MAMYGYMGQGGYSYVNPTCYGAVPGFTAPAYGMPMAPMGQMPPPYQMPPSGQSMAMNNMFWNTSPATVNIALATGCIDDEDELDEEDEDDEEDDDDDDDGDEDEDVKDQKRKMKKAAKKNKRAADKMACKVQEDNDLLVRIKEMYIDNMCCNLEKSGTLEPCEGTVKTFTTYTEEDGVCMWFANKEDSPMEINGEEWNAEYDCEYFRYAMKGAGTDEDAITSVVATRCNAQRQEIEKMYKTMYGRDIIDDIKDDLSGDYEEAVLACFVEPAVYDAWCIKEAIHGVGTDESVLIEVLMTRTNSMIQALREKYPQVVSPSRADESLLDDDIEGDTSGDFKRLCISAAQGNRNELSRSKVEDAVEDVLTHDDLPSGQFKVNMEKLVNIERCKRDAQELYEAGEDTFGTDEECFNRIFSVKDFYHARCTYDEYTKLTQRDILNTLDRETSGNFGRGLYAIVMNIRCRPMYFAERLRDAMKGLGTADRDLIRIIVSRSEVDMVQIKKCFLELTKKTLWKWIQEDCSGDYKLLLSKLVGKN